MSDERSRQEPTVGDSERPMYESLPYRLSDTGEGTPWTLGQKITLSALNLPEGASFAPASGVFRWQLPRTAQIGVRTVTFRATDKGLPSLSDSKIVAINMIDPK